MTPEQVVGLIGGIGGIVGAAFGLWQLFRSEKREEARLELEKQERAAAEKKAADEAEAAADAALEDRRAAIERGDQAFDVRRVQELERMWDRFQEMERLWEDSRKRVLALEETVSRLEAADRSKQRRIEDQDTLLGHLKALVLRFVDRVEDAWQHQREMPTLTTTERALLDEIHPVSSHHQ